MNVEERIKHSKEYMRGLVKPEYIADVVGVVEIEDDLERQSVFALNFGIEVYSKASQKVTPIINPDHVQQEYEFTELEILETEVYEIFETGIGDSILEVEITTEHELSDVLKEVFHLPIIV